MHAFCYPNGQTALAAIAVHVSNVAADSRAVMVAVHRTIALNTVAVAPYNPSICKSTRLKYEIAIQRF